MSEAFDLQSLAFFDLLEIVARSTFMYITATMAVKFNRIVTSISFNFLVTVIY